MTTYKWQFVPRFRRHAFGWQSDKPIQRIKEALIEIKLVAKKEPVLAAEGAVLLIEKISPALEQVDSSSGALGSTVNRAIETLVPIISKAPATPELRERWLQRLWQALQDDQMPYIEYLGDFWGELCGTTEMASRWADEFLPVVEQVWSPNAVGHRHFCGISACFSALYAAGRHQEILALLEKAPFKWWWDRRWGVKALVAWGKKAEAVRYAEESKGLNSPASEIAKACEDILLSSGLYEEAYQRYAFEANQGSTNLNTFRAIVKKYPHKNVEDILRDLAASQPGSEGKWFAAAKDAGLFEQAIELAKRSPTDPRTLIRAARDYLEKQPGFACSSGLMALHWMVRGHSYDITPGDVLAAYRSTLEAAQNSGMTEVQIKAKIQEAIATPTASNSFVSSVLKPYLTV